MKRFLFSLVILFARFGFGEISMAITVDYYPSVESSTVCEHNTSRYHYQNINLYSYNNTFHTNCPSADSEGILVGYKIFSEGCDGGWTYALDSNVFTLGTEGQSFNVSEGSSFRIENNKDSCVIKAYALLNTGITNISLSGSALINAGEDFDEVITVDNIADFNADASGYNYGNYSFVKKDNNNWIDVTEETAVAGTNYGIKVPLNIYPGFVLSNTPSLTYNGVVVENPLFDLAGETKYVYIDLGEAISSSLISVISITGVIVPVEGMSPSTSTLPGNIVVLVPDEGIASIDSVKWYEYDNGVRGGQRIIKFEAGDKYEFVAEITLAEGYTVITDSNDPGKATVTVNGEEGGINYGTKYEITKVFTAVPEVFGITYHLNGGTNNPSNPDTIESPLGAELTLLDPTRDGYLFGGWFTDDVYNKRITATIPQGAYTWRDLDLYAKWDEITDFGTNDDDKPVTAGTSDTTWQNVVTEEDVEESSLPHKDGASISILGDSLVASGNHGTVLGGAEIYPVSNDFSVKYKLTHIFFKHPFRVKVKIINVPSNGVKMKASHDGNVTFGFTGLTTNPLATCNLTDGTVVGENDQYTGGTISLDANNYTIMYTCSASTFVAYSETNNNSCTSGGGSGGGGGGCGGSSTSTKPTSTGGGGGGGGGSSSSCKNLPDNAVANNKSTPKSNTNYSYSTDTGAVCTFQCKTGYSWNENNNKCEESETINTGDLKDEGKINQTIKDNSKPFRYQEGNQSEKLANGYSRELNNAFEFAHRNQITTMENIDKANMDDPLIRIAMAKMLSQYAINILKKTPDTNKICKFSDVSEQLDADYNNGVTLACQLGIMGVGIDKFRPNDEVTRAEFGTALSRMLYGTADGDGAYYKPHLEVLKKLGIISNDNPDLKELRGYVMLMLMRSAM